MVSGERCYECIYCGKRMTDDLSIFCLVPDKPAVENLCYCVCEECKDKYKRTPKATKSLSIKDIKRPSTRKERP